MSSNEFPNVAYQMKEPFNKILLLLLFNTTMRDINRRQESSFVEVVEAEKS